MSSRDDSCLWVAQTRPDTAGIVYQIGIPGVMGDRAEGPRVQVTLYMDNPTLRDMLYTLRLLRGRWYMRLRDRVVARFVRQGGNIL